MSDETTDKPKIAKRPHGLGRGLSALLGDVAREEPVSPSAIPANGKAVQSIEVSLIQPHPEQPRRHFDEGALQELAESIAKRGVIQPIIVRPHGGGFQIIAGERRWRAAQRAQMHRIPAIVRDFDEQETLEIALIENIQREDLNPIEEAEAYRKLIAEFHHSQDALGRIVGKSRSHVANLMRLLELPQSVQQQVMESRISMGHARALIGLPDCEALARQVEDKGLSVRDTEKLVRRVKTGADAPAARRNAANSDKDPDIAALEQHLADILGLKVEIAHEGASTGGALSLRYSNLDQLDMLCQRLSGERI
ncbi:ParB/RepB/Spo0J family partition protein [Sphingobium cupriresistens]|uniref:ParB/RepB/Spo0J family partition protein n=1 Tax=Sphingobium cupriresistens TaxID=1132417 RepID=A0A8G1ZIZ4_9SPHN|nr:ParB/RepB/Spo0J family partition protein [Sphingobium cupriresistens]RYM14456.1 ParB/RepB/Spo0J family partition protein [Sphingobium cupriresistens]